MVCERQRQEKAQAGGGNQDVPGIKQCRGGRSFGGAESILFCS
jgi:hypothetical protein